MNPFLVKELRQFTRSRLVSGGLCLLLFAQLLVAALVPVAITHGPAELGKNLGIATLAALSSVSMFATCIALPIVVFARLVGEAPRGRASLELSTALSPTAVVDGKVGAGLVFAAALVAGSLPFQLLCVALRGVDLQHVLLSCAGQILASSVALHGAVFMAANRRYSAASRWVSFLIVILFGGQMVASIGFGVVAALFLGGGSPSGGSVFWTGTIAVAGAVSVNLMLRAQAARELSEPTTDRDRVPRLTFLVLWAAWGVAAAVATVVFGSGEPFVVWFAGAALGLLALLVSDASAPPGIPRRVLAERAAASRWTVFPLAPGFAGGVQFSLPLLLATILFAVVGAALPNGSSEDSMGSLIAGALFAVASPLLVRGVWMSTVGTSPRRPAPPVTRLFLVHLLLSTILLAFLGGRSAAFGLFGFLGIVFGLFLNGNELEAASIQWNSASKPRNQ